MVVNLTLRKFIFWGLTTLTVGLGILSAYWMIVAFRQQETVIAFGQTIPQWILPMVVLYLTTRNLTRLLKMRGPLLKGEGDFNLSGTLLGKLLRMDAPKPTQPSANRAQRRAARRNP